MENMGLCLFIFQPSILKLVLSAKFFFYILGVNCDLRIKGKHPCKKCRLEKCLSIGMDPKMVLNDEEKRERFKYFFKKKDAMEQRRSSAKAKKFIRQSLQSEPRPILPK